MTDRPESEADERPLGELFTRITGEESVTEQRATSHGRRYADAEEVELSQYLGDRNRTDGLVDSYDPVDGDLDW